MGDVSARRGALISFTTREEMRWDRAASARCFQPQGTRSLYGSGVSGGKGRAHKTALQTLAPQRPFPGAHREGNGGEQGAVSGKIVKSRRPDGVKPQEVDRVRPDGVSTKTPTARVARKPVSPGRPRHKPFKPSCGEGRMMWPCSWTFLCPSPERDDGPPRVRPAPGLPCALSSLRERREAQSSGAKRVARMLALVRVSVGLFDI